MTFDHVELCVPDREAAAAWYGRVLGFRSIPEYADWAAHGPLMLTNDDGQTMLALFIGTVSSQAFVTGWRRVAFRTDAAGFIAFIRSSGDWRDQPLGAQDIQDHDKSISVYFTDPFGNALEVTTYDHEAARSHLPT